jgi:hypothetical protein
MSHEKQHRNEYQLKTKNSLKKKKKKQFIFVFFSLLKYKKYFLLIF